MELAVSDDGTVNVSLPCGDCLRFKRSTRDCHASEATADICNAHNRLHIQALCAAIGCNISREVSGPVHVCRAPGHWHGGVTERIAVSSLSEVFLLWHGASLHRLRSSMMKLLPTFLHINGLRGARQ
jgi:hypothetical protein